MSAAPKKSKAKAEFGDFQTPYALALAATQIVKSLGIMPRTIVEPTCGLGAFVDAAASTFPGADKIIGADINSSYVASAATLTARDSRVEIKLANFFDIDWSEILQGAQEPYLMLGNPPWVTSAELGSLSSDNLPVKSNFHGRTGIEAITGRSNFDISEWMLLRYIELLQGRAGAIAVLCKTAVARKILLSVWKRGFSFASARLYKIDALQNFGASVDACFFVVENAVHSVGSMSCDIFASFESPAPAQTMAFIDGHIIVDEKKFLRRRALLGQDERYVWRSGIKHDCSKVMELKLDGKSYVNGLGERVEIEDLFLYPMLKSSDVGNGRVEHRSMMLVTQQAVGQDTAAIQVSAPKTWNYLEGHADLLERRGSSIYRNKPRFSIFGVGPYSFAPWKVAISGFYKSLRFVVLGPRDGRCMVLDDTVNFLGCASEAEANFLLDLLSSLEAKEFYGSMISWDEKRPITVELLRRLNIRRLAAELGRSEEYDRHAAFDEGPLFSASRRNAA
jgi:hypothetical protein